MLLVPDFVDECGNEVTGLVAGAHHVGLD
jgi:hypothetical protein